MLFDMNLKYMNISLNYQSFNLEGIHWTANLQFYFII